MKKAAAEANIKIVAGDTKVIEGNGGIYINTSGIGVIPNNKEVSSYNCSPKDMIIVSGNLGDHHASILSARMGIENEIMSDCAPLNEEVNILFKNNIKVKAMRDITRGGLGTILNEIANASNCLATIEESLLPIDSKVKALCDILGLDPLYMANEGKFLAVVANEDAKKAVELLRQCEYGKNAAIIGSVENGSGVVMKTRLGGERIIDILYGEGLPRIC
jgi:hydrogenase expression/formation protein HypE